MVLSRRRVAGRAWPPSTLRAAVRSCACGRLCGGVQPDSTVHNAATARISSERTAECPGRTTASSKLGESPSPRNAFRARRAEPMPRFHARAGRWAARVDDDRGIGSVTQASTSSHDARACIRGSAGTRRTDASCTTCASALRSRARETPTRARPRWTLADDVRRGPGARVIRAVGRAARPCAAPARGVSDRDVTAAAQFDGCVALRTQRRTCAQ